VEQLRFFDLACSDPPTPAWRSERAEITAQGRHDELIALPRYLVDEARQALVVEFRRGVVKQKAGLQKLIRREKLQLRQQQGGSQQLLLTARDAITGGYPIQLDAELATMRAHLRAAPLLI
jgi:hypothetical protein